MIKQKGLTLAVAAVVILTVAGLIGQSGVGGGSVRSTGYITSGNCAKWLSPVQIADGGACGGGTPVVTPNQDWYLLPWGPIGQPLAGAAMVAGRFSCYQVRIDNKITFTKMTVGLTTASAGGKMGFAIYGAQPTNNQPTVQGISPFLVGGVFPTDTAGASTTITVPSTTLTPGFYWMVWVMDNAVSISTTANVLGGNTINMIWRYRVGTLSSGWDGATFPAGFNAGTGVGANPSNPPMVLLEP